MQDGASIYMAHVLNHIIRFEGPLKDKYLNFKYVKINVGKK